MSEHNHEEAKKIKLLKIGVWTFSVLLLAVWIISLRFSVGSSAPATNEDVNAWQTEFTETIGIIRQGLDEAGEEDIASSTEITEQGREFIEELKNDVENIKPIVTSGDDVASSSADSILDDLERRLNASSTPIYTPEVVIPKKSCPEYINCMPTIGEARPCIIPPGCENYTQIAY
ncbi:hypothetical protein CVU83_02675 [Candidatus Falkowbacteria bacterium HGW-Falkowbacteria-2]|uniref:Uncharacterized protein n=1 Tax=Candidatus Falkowbacteria bacterium HGW-Falkowbacteria-2 TaxID=2013769 RepID=A0A2N2DZ33_9BACT|nr:MAG: hypothetical protein CVU83_02675 [Candidatus Falkowbacteria bacterium HGW-Falkowbacteria-2]